MVRIEIRHPQLARSSASHQIKELRTFGRKFRVERRAFERDLPVAPAVMYPNAALPDSDRRNEGAAVGGQGDSFFFRGSGGDLLRLPVGKALSPGMEHAAGV